MAQVLTSYSLTMLYLYMHRDIRNGKVSLCTFHFKVDVSCFAFHNYLFLDLRDMGIVISWTLKAGTVSSCMLNTFITENVVN